MRTFHVLHALVLLVALAATSLRATPCFAQCRQPPAPAPGESVTWTLAGSPYEVCSDVLIGPASRVDVEPGVVVSVNPERRVAVEGTLVARGLPEAPITLIGSQSGTPAFLGPGVLELSEAIVEARINAATVIVTNSRFQGNGVLGDFVLPDGGSSIREDRHEAGLGEAGLSKVIVVDGCVFESGGAVAISDNTLVLRNSTFTGGFGVRCPAWLSLPR